MKHDKDALIVAIIVMVLLSSLLLIDNDSKSSITGNVVADYEEVGIDIVDTPTVNENINPTSIPRKRIKGIIVE
ncbi:MAG: hypothetical protein AB7V77_05970 [Candidatus Woesearchaeota archaeon]